MANTLTGLTQFVYDSVDVVSRELVGFIPAVYKNSAAEQVAKNQNVSYDIVPAAAPYDIAPSNALPALDTTTVAAGTMAITKVKGVKFHWTGEDELAVGRAVKTGIENNKFAQAFRALANEMEADLAALYPYASRAYGAAGTTPFAAAGEFDDAAEVVRILKDNGAPISDLQLVINTAAGAKLIGYNSRYDIVGQNNMLNQGVLMDVAGCKIRESAQVKTHTKGTGTLFDTDLAASLPVGSTTIHVDTGSNTIVAGDVVTFDGDLNKYVVATGNALIDGTVVTEGDFIIAAPGLRQVLPTDKDVVIGNNYAANLAFSKSAIHLLTRLPKMPEGGDQADDVMVVQDPVSGIFFQIALYRAYRSVLIEVAVAWGVKAAKTEHIALLLG